MQLLVNRLKFAATPTAPGCARVFVRHTLTSWLLPRLVHDAELIVSELVTNAVRATGTTAPDPTYADLTGLALLGVQVRVAGDSLFIEVWDNDADVPTCRPPSDTDLEEFGRGLAIIQALGKLGVSRTRYGGKIVWAELPAGPGIAAVPQFRPTPLPRGYRRTVFSTARQPSEHAVCDLAFMERAADQGQRVREHSPRSVGW